MISYFCEPFGVYVFAGVYPDLNITTIPETQIGDTIKLKFRKALH